MIFTNKTSKTWAESEKKRSSKFVVLVFMGNAKTETYKRNEGEKKSKPTPSQISSSYTRYLEGRERREASNGMKEHLFPPLQSSTCAVQKQQSG